MNSIDLEFRELAGFTTTPLEFESHKHYARNELVHVLKAKLTCERQNPFVYETFGSWWQHFKAAVFPAWLLARFPAKKEKHMVSVETVYPFLKTKLPENIVGQRVIVLVDSQPIGAFLPEVDGATPNEWREKVREISFREQFCDGIHCPTCHRKFFNE